VTTETPIHVERRPESMAAIVTLDRPHALNAIDNPTAGAIHDAVAALDEDAAVRSIIITGAGDRAFCTGWDLKEATRITSIADAGERESSQDLMDRLFTGLPTGKPVIAAVNGYCIAGGVELALMCDMIVAAEEARFGLPEVRWSVLASFATQVLPRRIPRNIATEWLMLGEQFDAATAFRAGLVNRIVPRDRVVDEALAVAATIATRGPLAVRAVKEAMRRGLELSETDGRALASGLSNEILGSEDAREGTRAFVEKRAPRFTGQ